MQFTTQTELTQFLDQYRNVYYGETEGSFKTLNKMVRELQLPEFYVQKPIRPIYTINVEPHPEEKFVAKVYDDKGTFIKEFYTLHEPYDWIESELKANIKFTGKLSLTGNGNKDEMPDFVNENNRFLITHTDQDSYDLAARTYLDFLFLTEEYYKNPTNFLLSYRWVKNHPAFWSRATETSTNWTTQYVSYWLEIIPNDNDELVYMFEAGSAIEPARTSHYHDLRLDVYAPTFEDGFIRLAALVDKFFHLDGSERKNVSYIPSELETQLNRRLNESQEFLNQYKNQSNQDSENNNDE